MTLSRIGWALLALSALLAIAYGATSASTARAGASLYGIAAFKASGVVLLAIIALLHRAHPRVVLALCFGAAGDALLALSDLNLGYFASGAIAFLAGHLLYIVAFLRVGMGVQALSKAPRSLALPAIVTAAIIVTVVLIPSDSNFFWPLAFYTAVLTAMTVLSFTLPRSRRLATIGAVLFFISDGFVAANMFHPLSGPGAAYWFGFIGWMLYWAGQAGLCVGMLDETERAAESR